MQIERIEVQGGYLSGLNIEFRPGLNVLIGERGTGKTSVIELVRYCLGVGWFTEEARTRGHQQALAILGDGEVTVTVLDGGERVSIARTADGEPQRVDSNATVLAQNEIEAIGAQAGGRLRLIDRFRTHRSIDEVEPGVVTKLKATTSEIQGMLQEIESIDDRIGTLSEVPSQLVVALEDQAKLLSSVEATEDQREQLAELQTRHGQLSVRTEVLEAAESRLSQYSDQIEQLGRSHLALDPWPETAGEPDPLLVTRAELASLAQVIIEIDGRLKMVESQLKVATDTNREQQDQAGEAARKLRMALNQLQEGAGAITKTVDSLRERNGQLDALREMRAAWLGKIGDLTDLRDALYDELDALRDDRFSDRRSSEELLNRELGPQIRVTLTRSGNVGTYISELINAFRGSGIHYNRLAPQLAHELTPLEIVSAAESLDVDAITTATDIPRERAHALLTHLKGSSTADVVTAAIEDSATLELLDGAEYKPTDRLSIGQRCTVVLPILLTNRDGALIVDQPEDHLDNAFITSTLVERLRARSDEQQLIFSSHNPNIPVLGDADQVIVMGSDGRRGFKLYQGELEDPRIVGFVTSLLEGGAEAFRKRAEFYGRAESG